jgi:hypothetical protein
MLEHERKLLKGARTQYQREMSNKTELEVLLRETVEAVRAEKLQQKRSGRQAPNFHVSGGARFMMASASSHAGIHNGVVISQAEEWLEELNSQQDRERVIELLLSQERVIALLYEKTFPMTTADPGQLNYLDEGGYNTHVDANDGFEGAEPGEGQERHRFDEDEEDMEEEG